MSLDDIQYHRQVAFDALEANYENVLFASDREYAMKGFNHTVQLALELLPESDHPTVYEIQSQLQSDIAEITTGDGGDGTGGGCNYKWYLLLLATIAIAMYCYKYKWT